MSRVGGRPIIGPFVISLQAERVTKSRRCRWLLRGREIRGRYYDVRATRVRHRVRTITPGDNNIAYETGGARKSSPIFRRGETNAWYVCVRILVRYTRNADTCTYRRLSLTEHRGGVPG